MKNHCSGINPISQPIHTPLSQPIHTPQHMFHWVGVFWNVISVVIVGSIAFLGTSAVSAGIVSSTALFESLSTNQEVGLEGNRNTSTAQTMRGVRLIMAGTFIRAIQLVIEEQSLKSKVPAPLWVGMKGLWGVLLSSMIVLLLFSIG